jgi:hypothetical protein
MFRYIYIDFCAPSLSVPSAPARVKTLAAHGWAAALCSLYFVFLLLNPEALNY